MAAEIFFLPEPNSAFLPTDMIEAQPRAMIAPPWNASGS